MEPTNSLTTYLSIYSQWQKDILVCQNVGQGWGKRVTIDSPLWVPTEHYNHRNILDNEVVVEFDADEPEVNGKAAGVVCILMDKFKINYSSWFSGGKSVHVHSFWDMKDVTDFRLMKRLITAWLCQDVTIRPDYQLCVRRHMIRAEFGLHEKTGRHKNLLLISNNYPTVNPIPACVWAEYAKMRKASIESKITKSLESLEASPMVQLMLDTTQMRVNDDGRERILFVLIHVLKTKYKTPEDLAETLSSWYRYSNGKKLSNRAILRKVQYHWKRNYSITEKYLREVLEDVGVK